MNHLTVKLDGLGLELSVMTQSFFSLSLPIIWDLPLSHKQAQSSHDHLSTLTSGKDPFDISDPYRMYDECLKWTEQWLHSQDREFCITLLTKHPTRHSEGQRFKPYCFLWPKKFMTKFSTSFFVSQNNYRVSKVIIVFHNVFMTMKLINTLNITWITASKILLIIIYSTIVFWLTLSVAFNKKMKTVRLRWEPFPRIKFACTGQDLKGKHIY